MTLKIKEHAGKAGKHRRGSRIAVENTTSTNGSLNEFKEAL